MRWLLCRACMTWVGMGLHVSDFGTVDLLAFTFWDGFVVGFPFFLSEERCVSVICKISSMTAFPLILITRPLISSASIHQSEVFMGGCLGKQHQHTTPVPRPLRNSTPSPTPTHTPVPPDTFELQPITSSTSMNCCYCCQVFDLVLVIVKMCTSPKI